MRVALVFFRFRDKGTLEAEQKAGMGVGFQ
jgi:hypothetical protein